MKKELLEALFNNQGTQIEKVIACNSYTKKFGVTLSNEQALELVNERKSSLQHERRIEFGEGILEKLIFSF